MSGIGKGSLLLQKIPRVLSLLHMQAVNAAEVASSTGAAEAALGQVTAMLQPGQEPGSLLLKRLQAQLLLQLSRCGAAPLPLALQWCCLPWCCGLALGTNKPSALLGESWGRGPQCLQSASPNASPSVYRVLEAVV